MELSVNVHGLVPHVVEDYEELGSYAVELERAGVGQLVLGDMLLTGPAVNHQGAFRFEPATGFLEPLAALAVLAGATTRIRVSTGVLVAPLRNPIVLAKSAGAIDLLSGGRLDLVLAAGWNEELFDAIAVPFEERFARLDEAMEVCRALWTPGPTTYRGRWTHIDELHSGPPPTSPRIWLGAQVTRTAARRAVRFCEGWALNSGTDPDVAASAVQLLQEECDRAGRDPGTMRLRATAMIDRRVGTDHPVPVRQAVAQFRESAERCAELGIGQLVVLLNTIASDRDDADELIGSFLEVVRGLQDHGPSTVSTRTAAKESVDD